jgi:hypothetical protein
MTATLESLHHILLVDVVEGLLVVHEPNTQYYILFRSQGQLEQPV